MVATDVVNARLAGVLCQHQVYLVRTHGVPEQGCVLVWPPMPLLPATSAPIAYAGLASSFESITFSAVQVSVFVIVSSVHVSVFTL